MKEFIFIAILSILLTAGLLYGMHKEAKLYLCERLSAYTADDLAAMKLSEADCI